MGEGVAVGVEVESDSAEREGLSESLTDIAIVAVKRMSRLAGAGTFGTADGFAFRLEASQGFAGALGDKVAFYFGRKSKSKGQDLRLDIVS